jgi:hypothetical protein
VRGEGEAQSKNGLSRRDVSGLSRRDDRTQPGVSTPGLLARAVRPEGAADLVFHNKTPMKFGTNYLPPFQGELIIRIHPGVKTPGSVL